jgi:histidinol-phosphate/aromatic aminotransferase/cobyric acid decarboxylase-like protein
MVPVSARANGLVPIGVPVKADGDIDADGLLATGARIIYLCSPNNPTGIPHSRAAIERVIDGAPGVVILDEAYAEFADECLTAHAPRYAHVVVTRTMSKAFGLAGLRVGFAVGSPAILEEVVKARGPYRVNAFAERAATAALTGDRDWIKSVVEQSCAARAQFAASLRARGFSPLDSRANFLCVPVGDSRAVAQKLYAHGIAVRAFTGLPHTGDVLRIGIAPPAVMERVADAVARCATIENP